MSNLVEIEEVIQEHKLPKGAPRINWGPDFDEKSEDEKVAFLKKFADSFNFALDLMQRERNDLAERNAHLEKQLESNRNTINTQRTMVKQSTDMVNDVKKVYQEKIGKLEQKVRDLL